MQSFLSFISVLMVFISIAGIIYPFKPFFKRKYAFLSFICFFVLVGVFANVAETVEVLKIDSDPKASYYVTDTEILSEKLVEISTRREGSSGTSYAIRLVQCDPLRFGYIADGDSLNELVRDETPKMGALVSDSISDVISRHACTKVEALNREIAKKAEEEKSVEAAKAEEKARAEEKIISDLQKIRTGIKDIQWEKATGIFLKLPSENVQVIQAANEFEPVILKMLGKVSSKKYSQNRDGYELLSALRPSNEVYQEKQAKYQGLFDKARKAQLADIKVRLKKEDKKALSRLKKTTDKIEGINFYQHPNQPRYTNSRSTVYLYIGRRIKPKHTWLQMKVQYASKDWLFVTKVTAWYDGQKQTLISGRFKRDNNSSIWEWVDVSPDSRQTGILYAMANAKKVILRFEGQQYRKDVTLSKRDKRAIREVLRAYTGMTR